MKRPTLVLLCGGLAVLVCSVAARPSASSQLVVEPTNSAPNPYETIENFFKMPEGRTWGSTSAVAIDTDGKSIWVAERCGQNSCAGSTLPPVLHFSADGQLLSSFGSGMIVSPHGILVDRDGNIWVVDCACTGGGGRGRGAAAAPAAPAAPAGHQIYKFSRDGKLLMTLGKLGGARDPDFFFQPNNLAIAPDGTIFVAEGHSSAPGATARVMKFRRDGRFIASFGKLGSGMGEFDQPHALAFDSRGRLYVGDRNNNRIQIFDQNFTLLETWTQFSRPSGIFIDKKDVIYVTDSESESVARNHDGWKRGIRIGGVRDGKVQFFIPDPETRQRPEFTGTSAAEGIAVDAAGNIYGAEVGPKALKKYVLKK